MKPSTLHVTCLCIALLSSSAATAQSLTSPQAVKVTSVTGSNSMKNGYLLFTTAQPVSGCEAGFWLPSTDALFSSVQGAAKSALGQGFTVVVTADRAQLWPETTEKYCRIVRIG